MNRKFAAGVLAGVLGCGLASVALAQNEGSFVRNKATTVRERAHPEYDSRGVRLGAFTLDPVVRVTSEYSDNIFGTETNEESDVVVRVQPSLVLESNWTRHSVGLYANATVDRYLDLENENTTSWELGGDGSLDIVRGAKVSANARLGHYVEPRTSSNSVLASLVPIEYDQQTAAVSGYREFNRIRVTGALAWNGFEYDDGVTSTNVVVDQSYRDRSVTDLRARVDYAISPDTAVFVQARHDWRRYDAAAVLDRDSTGQEFMVGADFEFSNLLRGEIGAGYLRQQFEDATLTDFSGFAVRGRVEWLPTQLTTVTFSAERALNDSGIVGSAGILSDQFSVAADHELLRNLIITGSMTLEKNEFLDLGRRDDRFSYGVSATYLMNRRVGLTAGIGQLNQNSKGLNAGPDFEVNKVSIGLIAKY